MMSLTVMLLVLSAGIFLALDFVLERLMRKFGDEYDVESMQSRHAK